VDVDCDKGLIMFDGIATSLCTGKDRLIR
jgi:hypothetical protein